MLGQTTPSTSITTTVITTFFLPSLEKAQKYHLVHSGLKIAQKVAFNLASEASYVYILSGQKFIKNAKNGQFENLELVVKQCYQKGELMENGKIEKFK